MPLVIFHVHVALCVRVLIGTNRAVNLKRLWSFSRGWRRPHGQFSEGLEEDLRARRTFSRDWPAKRNRWRRCRQAMHFWNRPAHAREFGLRRTVCCPQRGDLQDFTTVDLAAGIRDTKDMRRYVADSGTSGGKPLGSGVAVLDETMRRDMRGYSCRFLAAVAI